MAGRQRKVCFAKSNYGREVMRPIISSDVMGNRNVEIVPVGAWVEPAVGEIQPDAVIAARIEEEKINRINSEKENRLRSFRRKVKKRVSHASQIKRQQHIQEAEKAFELERRVIQQSLEMGTSSRKDTCSMRKDDLEHAIKMRLLKKYGEDIDDWKSDREKDLSEDIEESVRVTSKARQQLMSKMSAPSSQNKTSNSKLDDQSSSMKVNKVIQRPTVKSYVDANRLPSAVSDQAEKDDDDNKEEDSNDEEFDNDGEQTEESDSDNDNFSEEDDSDDDDKDIITIGERKSSVKFKETKSSKKSKKSKNRPSSARLAALLSQFTESETLARQKKQQAAVSRRIFMDREREAVRENLRRKEHRKKITSLKKEKEAYRQQLESLAQKELDENCIDDSGEENCDEEMRQRLEEIHFEEMVERRKQDLRRTREMERYLAALRHNLIEKARRSGIQLPALCACGDIWDTHPETCANNCFFYKNSRAYARALQSLQASMEVM